MFIGKWCLSDDLFKMNIMIIVTKYENNKNNNNASFFHIFLRIIMCGIEG